MRLGKLKTRWHNLERRICRGLTAAPVAAAAAALNAAAARRRGGVAAWEQRTHTTSEELDPMMDPVLGKQTITKA